VIHRKGAANGKADALSKVEYNEVPLQELPSLLFHEQLTAAPVKPEPITDHFREGLYEKVLRINKGNEMCNELRNAIQSGKRTMHGVIIFRLSVIDGALYRKDLLWVLEELRTEVIQEVYVFPSAKHPGVARIVDLLRRYYYWTNHKANIKRYIRNCHDCSRSKPSYNRINDLLQPLPISAQR